MTDQRGRKFSYIARQSIFPFFDSIPVNLAVIIGHPSKKPAAITGGNHVDILLIDILASLSDGDIAHLIGGMILVAMPSFHGFGVKVQPHDFGKGSADCRIFGRFDIMILRRRVMLRGGNTE